MNLLAIDTALDRCSVGVARAGGPAVLVSETIGRGHAERLFGMVAAAMAEAGLAFADLDRIAVTVGPGSFTGVRVGVAAARGFALVLARPAVGIGTLEAIAEEARSLAGDVPVLAALDARHGEVYAQAFGPGGRRGPNRRRDRRRRLRERSVPGWSSPARGHAPWRRRCRRRARRSSTKPLRPISPP